MYNARLPILDRHFLYAKNFILKIFFNKVLSKLGNLSEKLDFCFFS